MTESEMWSIFEKCDGDPVMISQFVDWIMENDCSDDLKSLTDTLLWMRDNGKWPYRVITSTSHYFWGGHREEDEPELAHRLPLGVFQFLTSDCIGRYGQLEADNRRPVLTYLNLRSTIKALDHALRQMKNPKVGAKPEKVLK